MGPEVTCPKCGKRATNTWTKYGWRSDCCDLTSWAGKPLVTQATLLARNTAHAEFDQLWREPTRMMSRTQAYKKLAEKMGLSQDQCHISKMNAEQARSVVYYTQEIKQEHRERNKNDGEGRAANTSIPGL